VYETEEALMLKRQQIALKIHAYCLGGHDDGDAHARIHLASADTEVEMESSDPLDPWNPTNRAASKEKNPNFKLIRRVGHGSIHIHPNDGKVSGLLIDSIHSLGKVSGLLIDPIHSLGQVSGLLIDSIDSLGQVSGLLIDSIDSLGQVSGLLIDSIDSLGQVSGLQVQ
jgi:hypothetical protein